MNYRLFIVFLLGFSSGLPLALLTSTLQAWFSDSGLPLFITAILSLVSLPYSWRFFWAPLLDRYALFRIGKRRSWMLAMQVLLLLGFNLLAWYSPNQSPGIMGFLALILAFFSATQDIAVDAQRVEYLPIQEQALGASLAVFGYRIALLLSGGIALILAQHLGWATTYRVMGLCMFVGMGAVLFSQEPKALSQEETHGVDAYMAPIKELINRQGIVPLLLFIFCYKLGEAFTTTTSGIVMPFLIQGIGFSLETIGYVNKILGIGSILVGGIVAGLLLLRYSLYRALLIFGIVQAVSNVLFVLLAFFGKSVGLLALAVFFDNSAAGMGSTALVALLMRLVDKRYTGTQFSILIAFSTLPRIISGPIAATIQAMLGWVGLYQLSVVLALIFIPFLFMIKKMIKTYS
jgi:MFS transporter, PAT family, beta-lactamase induction signal transducer AmpG